MNLLAPAFLAALAALAVPIVLHLMHRPIPRRIVFPSLRFIKKGHHFQAGKKGLRDVFTLLTRLALLAAAILLFTRPELRQPPAAVVAADSARVVLWVDLSASMRAAPFAQFVQERTAAALAAHPEAAVAVLATSNRVELALPFSTDHAAVRRAVAGLTPSLLAGDHREGLTRLQQWVDPASTGITHVYLLTDRQRQDWAMVDPAALRLPLQVHWERPAATSPGNLAILGVRPELFRGREQQHLQAAVVVHNYALAAATAELVLTAGSQTARQAIRVGPESSARFVLTLANPGANLCTAELVADEPYQPDNSYHFWIGRSPSAKVAIVADIKTNDQALEALFVRQALATTAEGAEPFEVELAGSDFLFNADLRQYQVLVFLDALADYSGIELGMLAEFVAAGGHVIQTAGPRLPEALLTLNRHQFSGLRFTGFHGDFNQLRSFFIGSYDANSPILAPFAEQPADLQQVPLYRLAKVQVPPGANVLMAVDDELPVLIEEPRGKGRLLTLTLALSPAWSELPTSLSFVPLLRRMAVSGGDTALSRIVRLQLGEPAAPALEAAGLVATEPLPEKPGVHVVDGVPVEVNVTRAESDLRSVEEMGVATPVERGVASPDGGRGTTPSQPLAPYLALAVLVFLLLELVSANFRVR